MQGDSKAPQTAAFRATKAATVASAPPQTSAWKGRPAGTRKTDTARAVSAGLKPQTPSWTSVASAPYRKAATTPMTEPRSVAAAAHGLCMAMPRSIRMPATGLLTTKICEMPLKHPASRSTVSSASNGRGEPGGPLPAKGRRQAIVANAVALKAHVHWGTGAVSLPNLEANTAVAPPPSTVATAFNARGVCRRNTENAQPTRAPLYPMRPALMAPWSTFSNRAVAVAEAQPATARLPRVKSPMKRPAPIRAPERRCSQKTTWPRPRTTSRMNGCTGGASGTSLGCFSGSAGASASFVASAAASSLAALVLRARVTFRGNVGPRQVSGCRGRRAEQRNVWPRRRGNFST
mmetsp:Transcript_30772/g.91397  ORF Transcript_30772/g.91397 Transcript_30772/m.91397 type:complete len:348 (-) Transcript_30772:156-1199(-)